MLAVALIAAAYLLGSVPFGLILGKTLRGVDVRERGSGNIGFTNVHRVLGPGIGYAVLALDVGKGILSVALPQLLFRHPTVSATDGWVVVGCAMAVIGGHNWSVLLRFGGGKGVAAGAGALAALSPLPLLIMLGVWGALAATTRYVSLASIAAASLYPVLVLFFYPGNIPYLVFAVAGASAVVFQHRGNIERLMTGREHRIGEAKDT